VVRRASESGRPVLFDEPWSGRRGRADSAEFEAAQEEREFMRAVIAGLFDLEEGREVSVEDARRTLGLS